jgi:nitrogen fixation NifU-like protein
MNINQAREELVKHSKHPLNKGIAENFTHSGNCRNPLCGDFVSVTLTLNANCIIQARAQVQACTIATASASLLMTQIEGLSNEETLSLLELFRKSLLGHNPWPESLTPFKPLDFLRKNRSRIACALIAFEAVHQALEIKKASN